MFGRRLALSQLSVPLRGKGVRLEGSPFTSIICGGIKFGDVTGESVDAWLGYYTASQGLSYVA
jgi:hypothetical protein